MFERFYDRQTDNNSHSLITGSRSLITDSSITMRGGNHFRVSYYTTYTLQIAFSTSIRLRFRFFQLYLINQQINFLDILYQYLSLNLIFQSYFSISIIPLFQNKIHIRVALTCEPDVQC